MRTQPGDHANPARYLGEPGLVTARIWPGACANPARYLGEPSPAVDASGGPVLSSFAAPRARCHAGLLGALGNDCCRLGWLGARERTPALWHLLGSRRCCPRRTQVTSAHLPHSPRCPGPASPTPQVASQTPPNKGTCGPSHDTSDLRGCQSKAEEAMTRVSGQRQRMKPERGQLLISLCAHTRTHARAHTRTRARTNARAHAHAHTVPEAELYLVMASVKSGGHPKTQQGHAALLAIRGASRQTVTQIREVVTMLNLKSLARTH